MKFYSKNLSRKAQEAYAKLHGYFWLPCPLCGNMFGGHEWGSGSNSSIKISWNRSKGVCPNCHDAAREYNEKWEEENKKCECKNGKITCLRHAGKA